MNLPKKISPDHLIETIVEIRYTSQYPFEVVIGLLFNSLPEEYFYSNSLDNDMKTGEVSDKSTISFSLNPMCIFYNKFIKVECRKNRFIFNCVQGNQGLKSYEGWDKYRLEIEKVLNYFSQSKVVTEYKRLGLRYISSYENLRLNEITDVEFPRLYKGKDSINNTVIKEEQKIDDLVLIIRLVNRTIDDKGSIIDIDVIKENYNNLQLPSLMLELDLLHETEKRVFFEVLSNKYQEKLKIEY